MKSEFPDSCVVGQLSDNPKPTPRPALTIGCRVFWRIAAAAAAGAAADAPPVIASGSWLQPQRRRLEKPVCWSLKKAIKAEQLFVSTNFFADLWQLNGKVAVILLWKRSLVRRGGSWNFIVSFSSSWEWDGQIELNCNCNCRAGWRQWKARAQQVEAQTISKYLFFHRSLRLLQSWTYLVARWRRDYINTSLIVQ